VFSLFRHDGAPLLGLLNGTFYVGCFRLIKNAKWAFETIKYLFGQRDMISHFWYRLYFCFSQLESFLHGLVFPYNYNSNKQVSEE
jgi:hypothetical protein